MRKTVFLRLGRGKGHFAFVVLICFIATIFLFKPIQNVLTASGMSAGEQKTVILDPGHGGADPGAIGVNGALEKDINLSIALTLKDMLLSNGYKVIMTRETDISIHDDNKKSISSQKTSDIKNRLKLMNENKDAIVLLIHQNEFGQEKYHGAQMFFGRHNKLGEELAKCLQKSLCELIQPDNKREIKRGTSSVYLLWQAKNPIVLAECGFLSNYNEAKQLSDEEYQRKIAFALFCGITDYYSAES